MSIVIVLLQVFDIIIHAATNQLELLRVTANSLIIAAFLAMHNPVMRLKHWRVVGIYLALNLFFLAREGFTNPATGEPRTALFILVVLTTALSSLLLYRSTRAAPTH